MTKMFHLEIPLRLAVEADTLAEARRSLRTLYEDVMGDLPTGAGVFMDDAAWARFMGRLNGED